MTPIPAMQAAALTDEQAQRIHSMPYVRDCLLRYVDRPCDREAAEVVRAIVNAFNGLPVGATSQAALDAGEPQPVAVRYKREGGWRYLNYPFTKGWTFPSNLGSPEPLYASPVAAAPQGDAKPERVGAEGWKRLAESQQAFIESERRVKEISDRFGLSDGPGLRWQEDMRERLDEATKHLQANRWAEGFQSVQDALGLLDALGERGAVSPSCAATDQPQQEMKHG